LAASDDNKSGKITTSNDGKTRSQNKKGYQFGDLSYHPQRPYQVRALREMIDDYEFGALSKWLGNRQPSQAKQKTIKELFTSKEEYKFGNIRREMVRRVDRGW
jgi:hypothetical protein